MSPLRGFRKHLFKAVLRLRQQPQAPLHAPNRGVYARTSNLIWFRPRLRLVVDNTKGLPHG